MAATIDRRLADIERRLQARRPAGRMERVSEMLDQVRRLAENGLLNAQRSAQWERVLELLETARQRRANSEGMRK